MQVAEFVPEAALAQQISIGMFIQACPMAPIAASLPGVPAKLTISKWR